jgi:hypothetical protein
MPLGMGVESYYGKARRGAKNIIWGKVVVSSESRLW